MYFDIEITPTAEAEALTLFLSVDLAHFPLAVDHKWTLQAIAMAMAIAMAKIKTSLLA